MLTLLSDGLVPRLKIRLLSGIELMKGVCISSTLAMLELLGLTLHNGHKDVFTLLKLISLVDSLNLMISIITGVVNSSPNYFILQHLHNSIILNCLMRELFQSLFK